MLTVVPAYCSLRHREVILILRNQFLSTPATAVRPARAEGEFMQVILRVLATGSARTSPGLLSKLRPLVVVRYTLFTRTIV